MKTINIYINEKLRLTAKRQYTCQPTNRNELRGIIIDRIENEGPECGLNDIDTSKIIYMNNLFDAVVYKIFKDFNGDISMWNVSNVENMQFMFYGCKKFKQNLDSWDVSNVKDMGYMFTDCPTTPVWYDKNKWE